MHPLKECYLLTTELIQMLEEKENVDRDQLISALQEKLQKREEILNEIHPPFSEGETAIGKQIMKLNEKLTHLLNEEKQLIQRDLMNVKKKKNVTNGYINPFQSLQTDGYFYDKKN